MIIELLGRLRRNSGSETRFGGLRWRGCAIAVSENQEPYTVASGDKGVHVADAFSLALTEMRGVTFEDGKRGPLYIRIDVAQRFDGGIKQGGVRFFLLANERGFENFQTRNRIAFAVARKHILDFAGKGLNVERALLFQFTEVVDSEFGDMADGVANEIQIIILVTGKFLHSGIELLVEAMIAGQLILLEILPQAYKREIE